MKNRKAIFIAGMLVVLSAAQLVSASDNSIDEPSELSYGYSTVSEVIQVTKTENISKRIIKSKKVMLFLIQRMLFFLLYYSCFFFYLRAQRYV